MKPKTRICIASVAAGFRLKSAVKEHLEKRRDVDVTDLGVHSEDEYVPYTAIASGAAQRIQRKEFDKGILICGTGMGMALVANKFKGVTAAVCESEYSAGMARIVNDANVLALGQFILGEEMACRMVDAWLDKKRFEGFPPEWAKALREGLQEVGRIEQRNFK